MKRVVLLFALFVAALSHAQQAGTALTLHAQLVEPAAGITPDPSASLAFPGRASYSAVNVGGQILLGATYSVLFSVPSLAAIGLTMWNDNSTAGAIGLSLFFLSSYSLGTAVGVNAIASGQNPTHSLWQTWMYSAIGTGLGVGGVAILGWIYPEVPAGAAVFLAFPLAASMVYSLFLADWPASGSPARTLSDHEQSPRLNPLSSLGGGVTISFKLITIYL